MDSKRRKPSFLRPRTLAGEKVAGSVDLLTEILIRSPAESLVKFKCISKQWYNIITDPEFITNHTHLNPSPPISGIYFSSLCDAVDRSATPVPFRKRQRLPSFVFPRSFGHSVQFQDSSNGLFLFRCLKGEIDLEAKYVVCNPTTQIYKLLPGLADQYNMGYSNIVYYPVKDLYKVILSDQVEWNFLIFSSDTASWKVVKAPQHIEQFFHFSRIVYWDGALHWMCGHKPMYHCQFHVTEEKSEVFELPAEPKIITPDKNQYFGVSGGRLFLIQCPKSGATRFSVLEMEKGCKGWIVKFNMNLKSVFPEARDKLTIGNFSILYIMVGDEEKDVEIVVASRKKVVSYNLGRKVVKAFYSLPVEQGQPFKYGFPYQGSLATL